MKGKTYKTLVVSIIAILLLSILPVYAGDPLDPHTANAMWIEETIAPNPPYDDVNLETADYDVGDKFTVTVWLNITTTPDGNIGAWQFVMLYNKNHLNVTDVGVAEGTLSGVSQFFELLTTSTFITKVGTDFANIYYNATHDYVLAGESWIMGPKQAAPRHGALAWVEFEIMAAPAKGGAPLSSLIDISTRKYAGAPECKVLDTTPVAVSYTPYDCDYTFTWTTPPSPSLAVEHDGFYGVLPTPPVPAAPVWPIVYGPYPPAVNTTAAFDVHLYMVNLASTWELQNATLCLCYNTTVIDVLGATNAVSPSTSPNVTIAALWKNWSVTVTPGVPDKIRVMVKDPSTNPSGKVLVATFTFTVMIQMPSPPYPSEWVDKSNITICEYELYDHEIEITDIPIPAKGEVIINALMAVPRPWLEVDIPGASPDIVLGPEPALGTEFTVDVNIKGLDQYWELAAVQFRLSYCPDMLELVPPVEEGPFLRDFGYGKWTLPSVTIPAATSPSWITEVWAVMKIVITKKGEFDFTLKYHSDIEISPDEWSITVEASEAPKTVWQIIYITNHKTYDVTDDIEIIVGPACGVHMAVSEDISYYFDPNWGGCTPATCNWTKYPTWWDWLNGTTKGGVYLNETLPHHWDWMDWYVTEGSLAFKDFDDIWNCTGPPLLYNDTGAGSYYCFMDNCEICDNDIDPTVHDDPDIVAVLPWIRNKECPPYTFFVAKDMSDGMWGPNVMVGDLLLPPWNLFPGGPEFDEDGTIAKITFRAIDQDYVETLRCNLSLMDMKLLDKTGKEIPIDYLSVVNGTYTMLPFEAVGRRIDVYTQYPSPYGGQGPNKPSDMFWPQKEVMLYAEVTYNWWPVQQKLVTFTVLDPQNNTWTVLEGVTNGTGVAFASFRIPWPCENPEDLFGVWTINATVDIACEVVIDTLQFHFDYLVNIADISTDKLSYEHCEDVTVTVTFTSHAQQEYDVIIRVTIHDELNVPFATAIIEATIGGAEFCTAAEYEHAVSLHIEKFAFAGYATIHVVPLMLWNDEWTAAGPEGTAGIFVEPV